MYLRRVAASCALVLACAFSASAQSVPVRYLLGPQDHLKIRVYDLRRNSGEAYAWTALNGDFTVGADGTVSLPLIGSIKAAGGTPVDLAEAIGNSLKQAADLAEKPAASVEVATYRPFYITGSVQQPGKYEFQPNLTVIQAVSTAHGLVRGEDTRGLQRDAVSSRGDARALAVERIALLARQARLDAEISGADMLTFGEDLKANFDKSRADQAMRAEQLLFETRRNAIKAETVAIEQSINSFKSELSALDSKSKTLDRQLDLSRGELNLVSDLVSKGLTIGSRKLAAEQSQASFESNRLDVQVAILRAQQSLTRAERDVIDLKARFRREVLTDVADTNLKIAQNDERARTAERLTVNAESQLLGSNVDGTELLLPRFEITRRDGETPRTWTTSEDASVEPGDVIRVTLVRKPAAQAAVSPQQVPTPLSTPTLRRTPAAGAISHSKSADDALQRSAESANR